jgi:hypothetical protein
MKESVEALYGVKFGILLAGAVGGLVSIWFTPGISWKGAMMSIFCGAAVAYYTTPAIHLYANFSPSLEGTSAFLLGVFGMLVTGKVWQFLSSLDLKTVGEMLKAVLRRLIR